MRTWARSRDWSALARRPLRDHRLPDRHRLPDDGSGASCDAPGARDALEAAVEALVMVADEPLSARRIAAAAGAGEADVQRALARLRMLYEDEGSAFRLEEVAGGYQLLTAPEFHPWLRRLGRGGPDLRLSSAARETLAVVAYRQPVMRAEIEAIRGVQSGDVLRTLMEKGLVRIAGRHDSLGRPALYGTTKLFLQMLGLKSLDELPRTGDLAAPSDSSGGATLPPKHAPSEEADNARDCSRPAGA